VLNLTSRSSAGPSLRSARAGAVDAPATAHGVAVGVGVALAAAVVPGSGDA
jgi:hypothetical protein